MRRILILLLSLACLNSYAMTVALKERPLSKQEKQTVATALAELRGQSALDESTLVIKAWREKYSGQRARAEFEVYTLPMLVNGICKSKLFKIHLDTPDKFKRYSDDYRGWLPDKTDCTRQPKTTPRFTDDLPDEQVLYVLQHQDLLRQYGKSMALHATECPATLAGCDLTIKAAFNPRDPRYTERVFELIYTLHPLTPGNQCQTHFQAWVTFAQVGEKHVPVDAACPFY